MARRKSRQFKKKKKPKVEYFGDVKGGIEHLQGMIDKMPSTFDERFDYYFDTKLAEHKKDAGNRWVNGMNKWNGQGSYHVFSSKTSRKERKMIMRWFEDHFRKMARLSLWQMENGITYIVNKTTKTVYCIKIHPYIFNVYLRKYPHGRGNYISRVWREGEDNEYASGGHKTFFHEANLFFFKELGYEYELVDIAPGWWYNSGAGKIADDVHARYFGGEEYIVNQVKRLMENNDSMATSSETNAILQVVALMKLDYREAESNRIADQFERIVNLEFSDPRDAVLTTDSNGIAWSLEQMNGNPSLHQTNHMATKGKLADFHQRNAIEGFLKKNPHLLTDDMKELLELNPDKFYDEVKSRYMSGNLEQE